MRIEIPTLEDLSQAAKNFIEVMGENKMFAFHAEMGAGKTTLINEIMRQMGVEDHTSSPTFSIINEYFSVNYGTIFHFDFYRIKDELEALDIGVEEIFDQNSYCFIEWPEKIANLLPENCVNVSINRQDKARTIEIQP